MIIAGLVVLEMGNIGAPSTSIVIEKELSRLVILTNFSLQPLKRLEWDLNKGSPRKID